MIHLFNKSAQLVSWVKSNKEALESNYNAIKNLYYPETIEELTNLIRDLYANKIPFDLIGYSSNTLFLPSYTVDNLVCTKKLNKWVEDDNFILCDCGVNVSSLSKTMVNKGYEGFYGLTDLPGTLGAGLYGNCGCFGCSVLELVESFTFMKRDGKVEVRMPASLKPQFRNTSLKRHEEEGVILTVKLKKKPGNPDIEKNNALKAHAERLKTQPNAVNNLGTTFIGLEETSKYKTLARLNRWLVKAFGTQKEKTIKNFILAIAGARKFSKYLFNLHRYMFYDSTAHLVFPKYVQFMKSMFNDAHLEIEIRK